MGNPGPYEQLIADAPEAEIIDWCRSRVAGYKRPRSVAFITEADMPRTATGKIQHRILRDRYVASVPPDPPA